MVTGKFLIKVSVAKIPTEEAKDGLVVRFGLPKDVKSIFPQYILFFHVNVTLELTVLVPSPTLILKVFVCETPGDWLYVAVVKFRVWICEPLVNTGKYPSEKETEVILSYFFVIDQDMLAEVIGLWPNSLSAKDVEGVTKGAT